MRTLARRADARGGFIHVPYVKGQGTPTLPLATIVTALEVAIATALRR
jgi:pyroglutamyl-peptidase